MSFNINGKWEPNQNSIGSIASKVASFARRKNTPVEAAASSRAYDKVKAKRPAVPGWGNLQERVAFQDADGIIPYGIKVKPI